MRSKLHARIEKKNIVNIYVDYSYIYTWETYFLLYFAILSIHRQVWFDTQAGVVRYTGRCGSIHRQVWFDTQAGVVRYTGRCGSIHRQVWFDTQAGVVRVERLLLHKGDANNVFPTVIANRSVPRYGYCVSCVVPCYVYRDAPVHRCHYQTPHQILHIVISFVKLLILFNKFLSFSPIQLILHKVIQIGETSAHGNISNVGECFNHILIVSVLCKLTKGNA